MAERCDNRLETCRQHERLHDERADGRREIAERRVAEQAPERGQIGSREHAAKQREREGYLENQQRAPHAEPAAAQSRRNTAMKCQSGRSTVRTTGKCS